jgi:hypothetical protein
LLEIDESTDVSRLAVVFAFVHYCYQDINEIYCAANPLKAILEVNIFLMFLTPTCKNMKSAGKSVSMGVQKERHQ